MINDEIYLLRVKSIYDKSNIANYQEGDIIKTRSTERSLLTIFIF